MGCGGSHAVLRTRVLQATVAPGQSEQETVQAVLEEAPQRAWPRSDRSHSGVCACWRRARSRHAIPPVGQHCGAAIGQTIAQRAEANASKPASQVRSVAARSVMIDPSASIYEPQQMNGLISYVSLSIWWTPLSHA